MIAVCLALAACVPMSACGLGGEHRSSARPRVVASPEGSCGASKLLVPSHGAWWGVTPGAFTSTPKGQALADFERKVGRTVDIVHFYHRGAELFPTPEEIALAREPGHRRLLFLNWKPEMGHTWAEVAKGTPAVDAQIDKLAAYIEENFPERFFLTIHHEPEEEVIPRPGSGFTAEDYRAMFRHVVKRLRTDGVDDAIIVMNYMGAPKWGVKPWFDELYPGDDVVDWVGFDPYAGPGTDDLSGLVDKVPPQYPGWPGFYTWASRHIPEKPLMLAEWGVFEQEDDPGHKLTVYRSIARQLGSYPRIKAYVYFDSPNAPKGNTTVDSTPGALDAYRDLGKLPYLTHPCPESRPTRSPRARMSGFNPPGP